LRELERALITANRFGRSTKPAQKIGTRGVPKMVVLERRPESIHQWQSCFRTFCHRQSDGVIERNHRRPVLSEQPAVKGADLAPIRVLGTDGFCM
jgi:hypothetical protein